MCPCPAPGKPMHLVMGFRQTCSKRTWLYPFLVVWAWACASVSSSLTISSGGCSEHRRVNMKTLRIALESWEGSICPSGSHRMDRHTGVRDVTSYLQGPWGSWILEQVSLPLTSPICVGSKASRVGHQAPGLALPLVVCRVQFQAGRDKSLVLRSWQSTQHQQAVLSALMGDVLGMKDWLSQSPDGSMLLWLIVSACLPHFRATLTPK